MPVLGKINWAFDLSSSVKLRLWHEQSALQSVGVAVGWRSRRLAFLSVGVWAVDWQFSAGIQAENF